MGAILGDSSAERLHNTRIDVEEIVPSHARLSRNSSRDDDDIRTFQSLPKLLIRRETRHLQIFQGKMRYSRRGKESRSGSHLGAGIYVADVSGDSRSSRNVVKSKAGDERVQLHEEREWLSDAAGSSKNRDFAVRCGLRSKRSANRA